MEQKYSTILKRTLFEAAKDLRLQRRVTFWQNNDPKHTVRSAMERFTSRHIDWLERPSHSPDLNLGEQLQEHQKIDIPRRSPSNLIKLELLCSKNLAENKSVVESLWRHKPHPPKNTLYTTFLPLHSYVLLCDGSIKSK